LHIDPRFVSPPGWTTEATMRSAAEGQIVKASRLGAQLGTIGIKMDEIVERGYVILGSPDEVAAQLREVATDLNVGNLMMLLQFGNMNTELARYNTKMFADKVKPQLSDLFSEWEHHWWPNRSTHPTSMLTKWCSSKRPAD
jgi:alkanesulfonate monooxygenase SsuD/methylene tetrahydromethanopterin reductase-like flavin-dependent oxidoreductase (luciferase family)